MTLGNLTRLAQELVFISTWNKFSLELLFYFPFPTLMIVQINDGTCFYYPGFINCSSCLPCLETPPWEFTRSTSDYPWARQQMVFPEFAEQERIKLLNSWMKWKQGWESLILGHPIQSNSGNCLSIGNLQITCTWELFLVPGEVSWKSQGSSEEADYKITVPGSVSAHSLSRPSVGFGFIPGFVLLRKKPPSRTPKLIL